MLLTRDAILAATDLKIEALPVPEWGGEVNLRPMTGSDRDSYEGEMFALPKDRKLENMRARLVARCICDAEGNRLFSDAEVALLGQRSAAALDRVFDACRKLNRIGEPEVVDAGKASTGGQSAGSGSV